MSPTDKFCLKWNDFQENIGTVFGSLRQDEDFSDVTLASEDGHQIEAHKVILASSSPFFQNLFRRNKHAHPLIYMRGLKSHDILAIVDFIYYGEASVYQDHLDTFLNIAEELDLKGLSRANNDEHNIEQLPKILNQTNTLRYDFKTKESTATNNFQHAAELNESESEAPPSGDDVIVVPKQEFSGDFQELDEQIKAMMLLGDNFTADGKQKAYVCQVCGKEGYGSAIKKHIEANHIEGVSIPCNLCDRVFRSRDALRQHKSWNHK